jgi:hypothetical protein
MAHADEASVLFTISPDDSLNFGIRVYASYTSGIDSPPG